MADTLCKKLSDSIHTLWTDWAKNMTLLKEDPAPAPTPPPIVIPSKVVPPWMLTAIELQGTHETPGPTNNPIIMGWKEVLSRDVQRNYWADSVPWCGLFVDYCLVKNGFPDCRSPLWARSWAKYGLPLPRPMWGTIMTFVRNGGGHVGFLVGEDNNHYHILGGNQGLKGSVNVERKIKSTCIGWRWPSTGADCVMALPPKTFSPVAVVPPEVTALAK